MKLANFDSLFSLALSHLFRRDVCLQTDPAHPQLYEVKP
ncbi:hypothetical protein EV682_102299 [Iodobacter fluviatilis]|uniref:Uncharacterized protein n=1 Tax=Iodobacter fluviatilis TaxID=537 RepID=A0A377Q7F6_9NEIS|nr:hypothetical protein EV682_102299 [Iodobacter fluviatilis]STQ90757.1 Uncharacterised protein [Iodobacter fluviatilis]